jgi:hypothetical protein
MNTRVTAGDLSKMRATGRLLTVAGAIASAGLTLWVGRHGSSLILLAMFVVWVLLPFVALLVADRLAIRWAPRTRKTVYTVMLIVAIASVQTYANVALRSPAQPAFMFLMVPVCSWLVMLIAISIAAFVSRRSADGGYNGARP